MLCDGRPTRLIFKQNEVVQTHGSLKQNVINAIDKFLVIRDQMPLVFIEISISHDHNGCIKPNSQKSAPKESIFITGSLVRGVF